jgi:hypothetical protein
LEKPLRFSPPNEIPMADTDDVDTGAKPSTGPAG